MKTFIKGNYRKSIYTSDKGYVIGLFKVRDTNIETMKDYINKTITFTGFFHELNEDDTYFFYGEEIEHPRYGFQFQVSEYERVKPDDKDGIIEFLASDLFPGIGDKMASNIVETLGDNTLDKILENKECLYLVPKLTTKKADKIYEILTKYEESHKTIVYLTELGFTMKDALSIYNNYKNETIKKIEANIFNLIDDLDEITFMKVDQISIKMGFSLSDERRIKACILYMMNKLIFSRGDTYLYKEEILEQVSNYLNLDIELDEYEQLFSELVVENKIVILDKKYYLKIMFDAENNIVRKIKKLVDYEPNKNKKINQYLESLQKDNNIIYNEKQKEAIIKAIDNNILIITGGPGTGKTTIIKAITSLYQMIYKLDYEELIEDIALLAPTGRASKRMSDATLLPASTIHRFLKWNKETNEFAVNEYNKDNSKLLIIDEVSMIDINLLDNLFKGINDNAKIILVGDYNQLPSVGPGQVLKDLIESDIIDTVHLDLLYRQDENSYINTLALEIKDDDLNENFLETRSDYTFLKCSSNNIIHNLKNLCHQINDKGYDYRKIQIMAPMYAGVNGIDNLNKELQQVFNPKNPTKNEYVAGDIIYRENDKMLQLVNMPDDNIFNGDVGIIKNIISADKSKSKKIEIYVDFDGNVVLYKPKDLVKLKHGFAITIHKSQGSEYDIAIIPISNSHKRMLYRKLIYTGVTRAKKKLILIGEPEAFVYSVHNNNEYLRKTSLLEKLTFMYK